MSKVSKIENISFYFKICELIENNKGTKGLIANIDKVIDFIKVSMERKGEYDSDSEDYIEALKYWREAFEESQYQDPSWQIYISNGRQKVSVNLRPIRRMLLSGDWEPCMTLENMVDHLANELLDRENVDDFRQVREVLKQLQLFFNDVVQGVNHFTK